MEMIAIALLSALVVGTIALCVKHEYEKRLKECHKLIETLERDRKQCMQDSAIKQAIIEDLNKNLAKHYRKRDSNGRFTK